ncbi:MAG: S46 family peptidase, partial [Aquimonas sp.]
LNPEGAAEGELVMITGHPGSTQRLLTVAQLEALRDKSLIERLLSLAEMRGVLLQFGALGEEQARQAQNDLFGVENSFKALRGRQSTLNDPAVFEAKRKDEESLKAFVAADPKLSEEIGDPWSAIAEATRVSREIETAYGMLEGAGAFRTGYFGLARTLVRGADERAKPNADRLREFGEAGLPRVEQGLFAERPLYPDFEIVKLGWSLSKLREELGADHPVVRQVLGKDSPQQLAERVIRGTKLGDVAVRRALWEGGADAIAKSDDPMIALARAVDPAARELRARYEREVQAVTQQAAEKIARARFAQLGTGVYPDATFSLRLSYGAVQGWEWGGQTVPSMTYIRGLYERATGSDPYKLAPSWESSREKLNLDLPMNFVSTNDIIGGNSGSPVINAKAEVVGLVFDGNIHSLGGAFWYDARINRSVSVHSAAMIEALRKVYDANHLADEILD